MAQDSPESPVVPGEGEGTKHSLVDGSGVDKDELEEVEALKAGAQGSGVFCPHSDGACCGQQGLRMPAAEDAHGQAGGVCRARRSLPSVDGNDPPPRMP